MHAIYAIVKQNKKATDDGGTWTLLLYVDLVLLVRLVLPEGGHQGAF